MPIYTPPTASRLPPAHKRRAPLPLIIAAMVFVLIALIGILIRLHSHSTLAGRTKAEAIPAVTVVTPTTGPATNDLILPGNIEAFVDAPIYARTTGYLKTWYTDIGAHVKAGQLMADIETPEVDQQLAQAEADLITAKANYELAEVTAERWTHLLAVNAVSRQEADEKVSDAAAKKAQVAAGIANVNRLQQLQGFQHIVAPFDGVVTARNTDVGQLIDVGSGTGHELFRVASLGKLRIYVDVPQNDAPYIKDGQTANLSLSEYPGQTFNGTVVRTARSITQSSRTMRTEIDVDNTKGTLLPGSYTDVHLKLPGDAETGEVRLPANTLVFRAAGLQVILVTPDNHAKYQSITMGRDFGNEIEVASGVDKDDRVILNPPDALADGQEVKVAPPQEEKSTAASDKSDNKKSENDKGAGKDEYANPQKGGADSGPNTAGTSQHNDTEK
jgi:RND family efflux transporter MFP subunit